MPNPFDEFDGGTTAVEVANPFDEFDGKTRGNAFDEFDQPGAVEGTLNEFKRGLLGGQQQILAGELAAAPKGLTMRQRRRAFVEGMSDPRYQDALTAANGDPAKEQRVEAALGPQAKVAVAQTAIQANRAALSEDIAKLETEQQAIPQSAGMAAWSKADNSDWWKVLAKHPVEITAGIMAQSLPAMAPAMAANMVAPGGRVSRAIATGAGSFTTEAANAYLDSARQTGYDFTDPAKVREFFDSPDARTRAREHAAQRGVPVAVFDALTMGLAGKFVEPVMKQTAGKIIVGTGAEIALQAAGGAAGETAAQLTSGQELSVKDIAAEAIGEIGSGPQEVYSNLRGARSKRQAAQADPGTPTRPVDDELPPSPVEPTPKAISATDPLPAATPAETPETEATATPPAAVASNPVPAESPTPEAGQTIELQMDMLRNGKRSVVLITPGEAMPEVPGNMKTVDVPEYGTFIYSPRVHREESIVANAKAGKIGRILGYGIDAKPKPGTETGVVTVRNPEGVEKQAVVTDAENKAAVTKAAEKVADKGDTVQVETAEAVLTQRRKGAETQPEVAVTDRHLQEARAALETERPPDVIDDITDQWSGVAIPAAKDFDWVRERVKKLRQSKAGGLSGGLLNSLFKGKPADVAFTELNKQRQRFENVDELFEAMLTAAERRVNQSEKNRPEVRQLAEQIARAEAWSAEGKVSRGESENDPWQDKIDQILSNAIEATRLNPNEVMEGVTRAPVWMTKAAVNGLLRVVRATYRGTRNLAQAIQAGLEWLRAQNLAGYSETEAKTWLERNVTTTPQDDDINAREFIDQMDADQPIGADIARGISNLLYQRRTNESDAAFAKRIMDAAGGTAAAIESFTDATNAMPGSVRMLLGQLIIKSFGAAGQHEAAARFYDEVFAAHVTDTAQALQSLNAFLALTPEGKVIWAQRKLARASRDLIAPVKPQLDEAQNQLEQINTAGIEGATADPAVQEAARNAVDAALEEQAKTLDTELQGAIRQQVLDDLVRAGLLTEREAEIYRLHLEGTAANTTLQQKLEQAGIPLHEKRAKAINELYQAKTKTEREKIKSRARRLRREQLAAGNESALDKAIRKAMQDLRLKFGTIIRQHHTRGDATGKTLGEKIAAASGLTAEAAQKLADAVQRRFAQLVTQRKKTALEKLLKPVKANGLAKPTLADKLIAASNLGALKGQQFWDAVKAQLNLPNWTPELAERVREQVDRIEAIPEDQTERKQKAQIELLNLIERAKGVDAYDLGIAFYVTNILTGFTTHAKNLGSTFLNTSASLGVETARAVASGHLDDVPLILQALGQGFARGRIAAADVWRTGQVTGTRLQKLEPARVLELTRFGERGGVTSQNGFAKTVLENRLASVLNLWKYNFRLMAAEDLLFFKPAEEAKAALLAKRIARSEGLRGEAAQDRARQIMGYGKTAVDAAKAQAITEGFTGSAVARRSAEILNQNRPLELRENAQQFALRATFNNQTYGALGFVAHLINLAKVADNSKIRLGANLIAPFTNIIANVVNESLNYTPIGAARAKWQPGGKLLGYELGKLSLAQQADLRAELYAKALVGTALFATLALKLASNLDDKDPDLAIYGAGPASEEDRRGLEAKGWTAHTVKVGNRYYSYANTPMAIPFAWLGSIHDRMRDARVFQSRSAQRVTDSLPMMAASAAISAGKVISEQSFVSGIMQWLDVLSERSPEAGGRKALQIAVRTGSSFIVPNAVRQVDKFFDPKIYDQRSAEGMLVNAVPFVRGHAGQPVLNALGLPVQIPLSAQFTSSQASAPPLVKLLAEAGNWPSLPNRNEIYASNGRTMTDAEYYDYVRGSGAAVARELEKARRAGTLEYEKVRGQRVKMSAEDQAKEIAAIVADERAGWREDHGW